jgi:MFS family permease
VHKKVFSLSPLFLGVLLIGVCVGGQGTLVGLRATLEQFDDTITGLIISAYYLGFLVGARLGQSVIRRVGHVRTFGALTALSSVAILLHPLYVDPWAWVFARLASGFAMCGIFLVAESWVSQAADDKDRGSLFSIYMVVLLGGILGGQFLLTLAPPENFELFSVISVLLSLAAIPILVTATPTPVVEPVDPISPKLLFKWAPFGVVGIFFSQMCAAMIIGMAPVYASKAGYETDQIAMLMATVVLGALLFQWPMGALSDRKKQKNKRADTFDHAKGFRGIGNNCRQPRGNQRNMYAQPQRNSHTDIDTRRLAIAKALAGHQRKIRPWRGSSQ